MSSSSILDVRFGAQETEQGVGRVSIRVYAKARVVAIRMPQVSMSSCISSTANFNPASAEAKMLRLPTESVQPPESSQ